MANTVNVTTANTFEQWRVKTNEIGTAIGDLDTLSTTDSGGSTIIAALNARDTEVEANTAIIGTTALWDTTNYGTLRKAANKNHSDITTLASTAGIDLATNTLLNYDGDEDTLIAILDAQYAFDGGKAGATNMTTTAQTLAPAIEEVHGEVTTATTNIGTIGSLATSASNLVAAINEVHTETNTNTTSIGNIAATYVAVAGDTLTGQLTVAEADGSEAGINAATALTLGAASGTAITINNQQRIGIGQAAHATHKVDINGSINATGYYISGTDLFASEAFEDGVGAMFDGTETGGISATYNDTTGNIDLAIADDGHNHTTGQVDDLAEFIQDTVGAMVGSNTESGIVVDYVDGDGTLDFNVLDPTITLTGDVTGSATMTNLGSVSIATTRAALSVSGADIADNSIDSRHYVDGSIDNEHIADNAINSEHYADGSIDEAHLANDSVARSKLKSEVQLIIYNSSGTAVKTLYGAGS